MMHSSHAQHRMSIGVEEVYSGDVGDVGRYSRGLAPGFSCVHGRLTNLSMLEDMR